MTSLSLMELGDKQEIFLITINFYIMLGRCVCTVQYGVVHVHVCSYFTKDEL